MRGREKKFVDPNRRAAISNKMIMAFNSDEVGTSQLCDDDFGSQNCRHSKKLLERGIFEMRLRDKLFKLLVFCDCSLFA